MRVARPAPSRPRRRWPFLALVAAFAAALAVGGAYHRARAQLSGGLEDLGAQMMRYHDGAPAGSGEGQSAPRELVLNGQTLWLSSGTAARPAAEVLDVFEARCREVDGGLMDRIEALSGQAAGGEAPSTLEAPTLRHDTTRGGVRGGYVACLDLGPTSVSVGELLTRLQRYGETGDVGEIGEARYVFVDQRGEGADARTHFVALWTEGAFELRRMFPEDDDAPGRDPEGLRRPPDARRVLQGFERGQPHVMTVYETRRDEADLIRFFERALPADGWRVSVDPARSGTDTPSTFVAERDGRMAVVVLHTSLRTGRASAAIFETR